MTYLNFNNAAEELSFRGCLDPHRNPREVSYQHVAPGFMRVRGVLRDDSSIPAERPRARVQTLPFDVVVPEKVSLWDLQVVIGQQTQRFM